MITMVISAVLAGYIFWRVIGEEDKVAKAFYMVAGTVIGGLIGFTVAIVISALHFDQNVDWKVVDEREIVSMKGGSKAHRDFFLSIASFNQDEYYFFYSRTSDGGYRLNKVKADYVTIYEEKRSDGVLKNRECKKGHEAPLPWRYFGVYNLYVVCGESYSFHIPEGRIAKDLF